MKYGCCVNILPKSGPKTGIEYVQKLKDIGYDYVELPLNELSKLSNAEFDSFLLALQGIGFPCLCCNDFMPSSFRIVGEKLTSTKELQNYLELAMARLKRLGAAYSVFGSPWSRISTNCGFFTYGWGSCSCKRHCDRGRTQQSRRNKYAEPLFRRSTYGENSKPSKC